MGSDKTCCCGFLITYIWLVHPSAGDGHPAAEVPEDMRVCVSVACLLPFKPATANGLVSQEIGVIRRL